METKNAIFRNSKERIASLVNLSYEDELICLVYEGESLLSRVMYSIFCFKISIQTFESPAMLP